MTQCASLKPGRLSDSPFYRQFLPNRRQDLHYESQLAGASGFTWGFAYIQHWSPTCTDAVWRKCGTWAELDGEERCPKATLDRRCEKGTAMSFGIYLAGFLILIGGL